MNEQIDNAPRLILAQELEQIKRSEGEKIPSEKVNLAELQRLTNISGAKLQR